MYFLNTCAKYTPFGCESVVFFEHVCKMQLASQPTRQIEFLDLRNLCFGDGRDSSRRASGFVF